MDFFEQGLLLPKGGGEVVLGLPVSRNVPHDGGEKLSPAALPRGDGNFNGENEPVFPPAGEVSGLPPPIGQEHSGETGWGGTPGCRFEDDPIQGTADDLS